MKEEDNTSAKVLVAFYSAMGNTYQFAKAASERAEAGGAEVRLRIVPELAPPEAIASNPGWQAFRENVAPTLQEGTLDDLEWGEGYIVGSPTRLGNVATQAIAGHRGRALVTGEALQQDSSGF